MSITNKSIPPTPTATTTSPDVPLGINLDLTEGIVASELYLFQQDWLTNVIYYDKFTVSKTDTRTVKYKELPFRGLYHGAFPGTSRPIHCIPWVLLDAYFSSAVKVDWEVILQPVKVSDARTVLDIVTTFDAQPLTRKNTTLYQPTITYTMDSPLSPMAFMMPTYWVTENLPTPVPVMNYEKPAVPPAKDPTFPSKRLYNIFTPNTLISIFNALPYRGNDLFPDTFEVLIWLRPIIKQPTGIRTLDRVYHPEQLPVPSYSSFPTPYFMNENPKT